MARRTKYTPETIQTIVDALEDGQGRVRAVKSAGIDYSTFTRWIDDKPDFNNIVIEAEKNGLGEKAKEHYKTKKEYYKNKISKTS